MHGNHAPVYKSTTTADGGYIARHTSSGCCGGGGRKRRLQLLLLFGAIFCSVAGIAVFVVSVAASPSAGASALLLLAALSLLSLGVALTVLHLRARGRINLPCWPSRAARLSHSLIQGAEDPVASNVYASYPRSATETTLDAHAVDGIGVADKSNERVGLMESSSDNDAGCANVDDVAGRIDRSQPKVVLM